MLPTTRPELTGTFGMVASTHYLASAAGMAVLERGGNAFDAACAAGFVLQVVEPHLNGPGGDAPILLWDQAAREVKVVCGQGVSPAAGTLEAYAGLDLVPGTGLLAATVPGAFGAWITLLERWGTWELADVLEFAIGYAERGWPVLPSISAQIGAVERLFVQDWAPSAATWLPGGAVPAAGTMMRSPGMARTYRRVLAEAVGADREERIAAARRAWYQGFVAEAIEKFCAGTRWADTSGQAHGGLLTGADLAGWVPPVEDPVTTDYRGHTICKTGPWGQGPVLLQQLSLLERLDAAAADPAGPDFVHLVTEAAKLAFADRDAWYGDPDHSDIPLAGLLSADYAADRAGLVGESASLDQRPGSPDGREPVWPAPAGESVVLPAAGIGEPTIPLSDRAGLNASEPLAAPNGQVRGDTCHLDVVDRWGNMVSATPSGGWLQSSPTIPDLGFCLGTRAQMFWLTPGLPNSLRPKARPRTTLTPTLVLRGGEPVLACGTPGGDQQDQWQVPFLLRVIDGNQPLQAAIDAPMFHSTHVLSSFYPRDSTPGGLVLEDRFDPAVIAELERRGHRVNRSGPWSLGRLSAVSQHDGVLHAAANPRGAQGYAVGR